MSEKIHFSVLKQYFRTGDLTEELQYSDLTINQLQGIALRRQAILAERGEGETPQAAPGLRAKSREVFAQPIQEIDHRLIEHVMASENLNYDLIVNYLKNQGITEVPILSTTPDNIVEIFQRHFKIRVIPSDQIDFTDFSHVLSESEIPAWFREAQEKIANSDETVGLFATLRERWFLLAVLLLAVASAVGFSLGWGVRIEDIIGQVDLYFSIYGIATVSRSVWQIRRAEKWNSQARNEIRTSYSDAFEDLLSQEDPDFRAEGTEFARKLTSESSNWDDFKKEFGIAESSEKRMSLIDEYIVAKAQVGQVIDRETVLNQLAEAMIRHNFGDEVPTVAFVVPTYQTSLEEMEGLLRSAKDQVYPVTNVYVVYNDDPNDPKKTEEKQKDFLAFQSLVTRLNGEQGRNNCKIHLLAQPARGKREAMAMGFAHSLGREYIEDLKRKYPEADREELSQTIANLDLDSLPDFRHDFTLNIDSDTRIADPFALLNSAILMKHHPEAATTTGDVRVVNRNFNLLSEMTFQRYWRAFFVERAAQSLSGEVTCMSGPWVFMRSEALAEIFEEWYFQEFLDQRSTYGDDRHLTTLFLREGWKTLFCPDSAVLTDCPTDWKTFLKQQLRWNKSFNRENFILFNFIHTLDRYVQLDVAYQQLFAFAMLYIMTTISGRAIEVGIDQNAVEGLKTTLPYAATVLLYNELFFGVYGALKNKDPKFLASPVYIAYHFGGLLWLKLYAFFKMKDTSWGTKGEAPTQDQEQQLVDDFAAIKDQLINESLAEIEERLASGEVDLNEPIDLEMDDDLEGYQDQN